MHKKGCLPSKVDIRDYRIVASTADTLPVAFFHRLMPKVKNQGAVSSCVAHATSSILEFFDSRDGKAHELSTNFIYGIQKKLCGHDGEGMYLRDACHIVKEYGDPVESLCKGNTEIPNSWEVAELAFNDEDVLSNANYFRIHSYYKCKSDEDIKKAVYKYGPVLACVKWYDDFKVDKDGTITSSLKGNYCYHAVVIYGWNAVGFCIQNSWGTGWGQQGAAVLPYNIKVTEARAFIDASIDIDDNDVVIPKRSEVRDFFISIINWILNLFRK